MKKKVIFKILCYWGILLAVFSCSEKKSEPVQETADEDSLISIEDTVVSYATIAAVGDVMVHRWQMQRAYNAADSSFDFTPSFKYVKPIIEDADFAIGNLETTFAGKNQGRTNAVYGYSCFPYFNAPEAMAVALKHTGFDLFSTANNHSLDTKISGLRHTLDILDSIGLYHVGTYRNLQESDSSCIIPINGIKVGFMGCTNSLNGNTLKSADAFSINEFRKQDSAKVAILCKKIKKLKEDGADAVIAIVHFGEEYQRKPNRRQKQTVKAFAEAGADVILGSHPHILQNLEWGTHTQEGKEKNVLVAYSMGNFISSQIQRDSILKDVGAILKFRIKKSREGIAIDQLSVMPTYSYWNSHEIGVVPLIKAYHDLKSYPCLTQRGRRDIKNSKQQTIDVLTSTLKNQYEIDTMSGFINFSQEPQHLAP
jgi:poly-gamma-glutamate synthesis protein (capsule biosynthesis protein)